MTHTSRRGIVVSLFATTVILFTHGTAIARTEPGTSGSREIVQILPDGSVTRYLAPARTTAELQAQIRNHLARFPGGTQINDNEISYNGGRFVMTFAKPGGKYRDLLASDCAPFNWFCFYDGLNFTYPRGRLSDCGWQDLLPFGWIDRTESAAQTNTTGPYYVTHIGHEGMTPNHSGDDIYFFTDTWITEISDVTPFRNASDHVYKNCPFLTENR